MAASRGTHGIVLHVPVLVFRLLSLPQPPLLPALFSSFTLGLYCAILADYLSPLGLCCHISKNGRITPTTPIVARGTALSKFKNSPGPPGTSRPPHKVGKLWSSEIWAPTCRAHSPEALLQVPTAQLVLENQYEPSWEQRRKVLQFGNRQSFLGSPAAPELTFSHGVLYRICF